MCVTESFLCTLETLYVNYNPIKITIKNTSQVNKDFSALWLFTPWLFWKNKGFRSSIISVTVNVTLFYYYWSKFNSGTWKLLAILEPENAFLVGE